MDGTELRWDWRHPWRSRRAYRAAEYRYRELKTAYGTYFGSDLWRRHTDAFLAAKGHLPIGPGNWRRYHWGGPEVTPPREYILRDICLMEAEMGGNLVDACDCHTCTRHRPSSQEVATVVAQAMAGRNGSH